MNLNVKAFALSFGIWWGVGIFLLTWWIIAFGGGASEDPTFLGRIYIGYAVTPLGSAIGLAWGFVDALIAGAIFAWLYNLIAAKLSPGAG